MHRPVPKFLRGGPSAASQGSALAPMTGTIVKVTEGMSDSLANGFGRDGNWNISLKLLRALERIQARK